VVKIDLASATFILGIVLLIILFWGDPDLHDGLVHRLMADHPAVESITARGRAAFAGFHVSNFPILGNPQMT
jgi:hypothetical protein